MTLVYVYMFTCMFALVYVYRQCWELRKCLPAQKFVESLVYRLNIYQGLQPSILQQYGVVTSDVKSKASNLVKTLVSLWQRFYRALISDCRTFQKRYSFSALTRDPNTELLRNKKMKLFCESYPPWRQRPPYLHQRFFCQKLLESTFRCNTDETFGVTAHGDVLTRHKPYSDRNQSHAFAP